MFISCGSVAVGWYRSLPKPVKQLRRCVMAFFEKLKVERVLSVDETGHRDRGKRMWTWCFRSEGYTVFRTDASRGSQVLLDVLGVEFDGVIGCDHFSA